MTKTIAKSLVLAACVLAPACSFAAGASGGNVLKLGAGSRAAAMSDAFTAGSGDASVLFYNPAGLAYEEAASVMASHALWFESVSYTAMAYSRSLKDKGAFGVGLQMLNYGSIDSLDNTGASDGSYSPRDIALGGGWGKKFGDDWAAGAQAKLLSCKIDKTATAFLLDLGAQYRRDAFTAGFALQNLGTKLKFNSESESVSMQPRLGAAYAWPKVTVFGDINMPTEAKSWLALGAEYKAYATDELRGTLRAGYSTRMADVRQDKTFPLSFGLGIGMKLFGFDYAFVPYGDLGSTHHITLSWRWDSI